MRCLLVTGDAVHPAVRPAYAAPGKGCPLCFLPPVQEAALDSLPALIRRTLDLFLQGSGLSPRFRLYWDEADEAPGFVELGTLHVNAAQDLPCSAAADGCTAQQARRGRRREAAWFRAAARLLAAQCGWEADEVLLRFSARFHAAAAGTAAGEGGAGEW
jgi:hypothetical protein